MVLVVSTSPFKTVLTKVSFSPVSVFDVPPVTGYGPWPFEVIEVPDCTCPVMTGVNKDNGSFDFATHQIPAGPLGDDLVREITTVLQDPDNPTLKVGAFVWAGDPRASMQDIANSQQLRQALGRTVEWCQRQVATANHYQARQEYSKINQRHYTAAKFLKLDKPQADGTPNPAMPVWMASKSGNVTEAFVNSLLPPAAEKLKSKAA